MGMGLTHRQLAYLLEVSTHPTNFPFVVQISYDTRSMSRFAMIFARSPFVSVRMTMLKSGVYCLSVLEHRFRDSDQVRSGDVEVSFEVC
jgi:hypothetical protein